MVVLLGRVVWKVVPIFCLWSSSALWQIHWSYFLQIQFCIGSWAWKKKMYYHKSIRLCNEAMGRSSSKSQRRSLQHLVYPPVKFGNKLIAKAGRFRRHSVKFQEFLGMEISVPVDKMFQLPWVQLEFLM